MDCFRSDKSKDEGSENSGTTKTNIHRVKDSSNSNKTLNIGTWNVRHQLFAYEKEIEITLKENDLDINVLKGKQLTNVRASGTDEAVRLTTPVRMSLEQAIAYIDNDELVEVTPNSIRLRKRFLDPHERKRQNRLAS